VHGENVFPPAERSVFFLVIVDDFDFMRISPYPFEAEPPLVVNPNAVLSGSISLKFLQVIGRYSLQVAEFDCVVRKQLSVRDVGERLKSLRGYSFAE
jgi:hypothetical protein